jgi:hypothetical protein
MDFEPFLVVALRLCIIFIGGLSIYLGYRLFLDVKTVSTGHAEVKLPNDFTIMVSRIGPGVFFALFGALVVGTSLVFPVQFSKSTTMTSGGVRQQVRNVSGIGERPEQVSIKSALPGDQAELERRTIREQVRFLNQIPGLAGTPLTADQQVRIQRGVREVKLRLMKSAWHDGWGQYEAFAAWAQGGAPPGDSPAFVSAKEYFETGKEGER